MLKKLWASSLHMSELFCLRVGLCWEWWTVSVRRLQLGVCTVHLNSPQLITLLSLKRILHFPRRLRHILTWISRCCCFPNMQSTYLAAVRSMFSLAYRMLWIGPDEITAKLAASQTVFLVFSRIYSFTWSTFKSLFPCQRMHRAFTVFSAGRHVVELKIDSKLPLFALRQPNWSVYTCLTQLYDGRDMYMIYYIKNSYVFRPFTLAIIRLRNEKNLVSSYTGFMWVVYSGEVMGEVCTRLACVV
jgi:hypothetical protein